MTKHREEALRAIAEVTAMLDSPEPIEGLRKHMMRATLQYAVDEVQAIQETKRLRKATSRGDDGDAASQDR